MKSIIAMTALALASLAGSIAHAETMVYVHGWHDQGRDFSSENLTRSSAWWREEFDDRVMVGWNTGEDWRRAGVTRMKAVLDARCARGSGASCTVICHSTGCPVTGATLDFHGSRADGTPAWSITRVLALGSAEGGSELAGTGYMANRWWDVLDVAWDPEISPTPNGVVASSVAYLTVSQVRGAYDHHDTKGVPFFHVAGYDGGLGSFLIDGQDDGTVGFHSACGYVKQFDADECSNDWEWVRKTKWGAPYYVMRTIAQWTNHKRVETCGRDGCNKGHMDLLSQEFQRLAAVPNP